MSKIVITPMRHTILQALCAAGGSMPAIDMAGVWRSLASRMQGEGLVIWEPPKIRNGRNCDGYILHLTSKGRAALQKAK